MKKIIEAIEKTIKEISNLTDLPVYRDLKNIDDVKEFIVLNYEFQESVWSNDKAEGYVIYFSILIGQKSLSNLLETIKNIYDNTDFDLLATGINKDHFNYEAVMLSSVEVLE